MALRNGTGAPLHGQAHRLRDPGPSARSAAALAADEVAAVRDDPAARLALLRALYQSRSGLGGRHLPYRRAAESFMRWQLQRGLLNPPSDVAHGSAWWRAANERLLRDTAESRALFQGLGGEPSADSVRLALAFVRRPSARAWYRAHNATIVAAYLEHRELAESESRVERFFINLVLVRLLYAHALVAAPRLALSWCAPVARPLGDPRLGMAGIFLSLGRVLPDSYPAHGALRRYVDEEHGFGRLLDVGLIRPRLEALYAWSAVELSTPALAGLQRGGVPAYAWDPTDDRPWDPEPTALARIARRVLPGPDGSVVR